MPSAVQRLWGLWVLLVLCSRELYGQARLSPEQQMLGLVNRARGRIEGLVADAALSAAAAAYAAELEMRGVLDHVGLDGQRVSGRLRRLRVTEARVGEVLGAGPDARAVVEAWLASPGHEVVVRDPTWTHAGAGRGPEGRVWVVVFVARRVADLVVHREAGGVVVSGRFLAGDVATPALFVDLDRYAPVLWENRSFRFVLARLEPEDSYVRLGYFTALGSLRLTNVISTWTPWTPEIR